ncbi:hypothetical protein ACQ4PT_063701 [Festuca glaucescens]
MTLFHRSGLSGVGFRVLQTPNEEEEGDAEEISSVGGSEAFRYLCRTPPSVGDRDISEGTPELAWQTRKRIIRQRNQRMKAMAAMELTSSAGMSSPSLMPLGMSVGKTKIKTMPVLEPSVFMDDDMDGWTVIRRRRWSPAIGNELHDPRNAGLSKTSVLGSARTRAGANLDRARWGPNIRRNQVHAVVEAHRADGVCRSNQVKIGNQIAGRAFRKLLGLAWRKVESGEAVVPRRCSILPMNGDGGQGGFNPGRGGFNAGRGGYQGRGGFGARRGANGARGRHNQGGGRGGHGFGGGQGYGGDRGIQGNTSNNGFGRNFVQGEASGTAGMNGGQGYQQENWGGGSGNFQRGANYHNANINFGGNQQRWNNHGRGGYQQRFRTNGHDVSARTSIDADLLQQTVQAVVAAVTAAQKTTDDGGRMAVHAAAGHEVGSGVPNQPTVVSVAAPTVMQQQVEAPNQEVEDAHVVGTKGKESEGQGPSKKKKEDKMACFRCKKPGHYIDDCPTPFCDLCESIHHVASACHLLQAPKPTATIHGYANEALMFFELPCGAFKAKVENPKLAKVTVDGDAMTIPEIIEQLKRIVPYEKFNWEVFHFKDNIFRVKLPSKQEEGFFKLRFEVEIAQGSQEVSMVDANNGNDGNDGAHHGEGKNGGGHAMDMDNKGNDADATSNNNEQDASNVNNGVDGMQEKLHNIDAIQIGTMHVKLTPTGTPSYESNLSKNELFYKSLSHVENLPQKNKFCTDFGAYSWPSESTSGSPPVGTRAVCLQAASGQQRLQAASGQKRLHADREQQRLPVSNGSLSAAASRRACSVLGEHRVSSACGADHPATATCGRGDREEVEEGFSAAGVKLLAACASIAPQKIQQPAAGGPGLGAASSSNHLPMIGTADAGLAADDSLVGSSVHVFPVANGMTNVAKNNNVSVLGNVEHCMSDFTSNLIPNGGDSYGAGFVLEPNLVSSLEQTKGGITDEVLMTTRGGLLT